MEKVDDVILQSEDNILTFGLTLFWGDNVLCDFPYIKDLFTHIIKTFLVNSNRGQLIFSTHNLMLLDEDYIRRDMVYFANKSEAGATELYRAKDFGLHKEVSILNAYRAGKLGAKPQLGSIFIDA